jgi:hypothetical protein
MKIKTHYVTDAEINEVSAAVTNQKYHAGNSKISADELS